MTLDELYGCSLGEYLDYHSKSKDDLIDEIIKDIELLEKSRMNYANHKDDYSYEELVQSMDITKTINKKRKHLERVEAWE